jgi:hypothetical protein
MAFLCVSQHGELKNTLKNVLGEIQRLLRKTFAKKLEKKKLVSCRFFLRFVYRVFGRFSA